MLTVKDLMRPGVRTISPNLGIWSALAIMREERFWHLLVTEDDSLLGVLSNRDYRKLLEWIGPDGRIHRFFETRVADIMTPAEAVPAVSLDAPLDEAAHLFLAHETACLPVVDSERRLLGILAQQDVMRVLLAAFRSSGSSREALLEAADAYVPISTAR
jgi:acetoin utilization protein AcuB